MRIAGSIGERGTRGERTDSAQSSGLGLLGTGESKGIGGVGAASVEPEIASDASTRDDVDNFILIRDERDVEKWFRGQRSPEDWPTMRGSVKEQVEAREKQAGRRPRQRATKKSNKQE